jgi:hypothetical protein
MSAVQQAGYKATVQWLEEHGETLADANADFQRWDSWSRASDEYDVKSKAEVAARKAREAKEKQPPQRAKSSPD